MFVVLACIRHHHDWPLLVAGLLICIVSIVFGLEAYHRATSAQGGVRLKWSGLAGLVTGGGAWTLHFLSMLAYRAEFPANYGFGLTVTSLIAVIAVLGGGFWVAARSPGVAGRAAGGAIMGAGIAAMHFLGVAAMDTSATFLWSRELLATAIAISVLGGALGMSLAGPSVWRRLAAPVLLALTIDGLHFTAMSAITVIPGAPSATAPTALSAETLAWLIAGVVALILAAGIGIMAVAQAGARSALHSLQAALDGAPSAIAFFDSDQKLTFWNKGYADIFSLYGLTPALGLRFGDILGAALAAGVPYGAPDAPGRSETYSWRNPPDEFELPGGRRMSARTSPTADGGMVAVMFDITMARRAEVLARTAQERAEAANRSKSDFLANMGHEIRTPLNGVLGMAQVMAEHTLDPDQRERLDIIKTSGGQLLGLLNDILDLARMESGKLELREAAFDIHAELGPICEAFAATASLKEVKLGLTVTRSAQGLWRGDARRIRQITNNLVANAVKFTSRGTVRVMIEAPEGGLRIVVADTGIGMKAEQIPALFENFTQADGSSTRAHGGTGLGLAICRDLAQLMGGDLRAESVEGEGSTFIFEAPLTRVEPAPCESAFEHTGQNDRLRVLAAEDNITNQMVLKALLGALDVDLVMTADGDAAVREFEKGGFDIVLMDIQMPKLNGVEATRAIRAWEDRKGLARTPVLAVTANVMTHQISDYFNAGMDGVVAKPIEAAKLYSSLSGALMLDQAA